MSFETEIGVDTLYVSAIDYENKTVTFSSEPPVSGSQATLSEYSMDGKILRKGVTLCSDSLDGPIFCPWPQKRERTP